MRYLIFSLFICLGCKSSSKEFKGNYSQEKIVAVMVDLFVAEAAIKDVDEIYLDSLTTVYKSKIEQIHHVDINLIEEDIAMLQRRPTDYSRFHEIVEDSIVFMEKRLNKKKAVSIEK